MRTSLAAVTALTGSLLLPFLLLGSAQAVTSAPDLKNVISTTDNGTVTPVGGHMGGGGFGGHMGGFAGHMSGMGVGHIGGMGGHLPVAPSMVAPDLPGGSSITVTSITGTS